MIWAKDGWHRPKLITSGRDCTVIMVMMMTVMLMVMTMVNVIKMVIMSGGKIKCIPVQKHCFFSADVWLLSKLVTAVMMASLVMVIMTVMTMAMIPLLSLGCLEFPSLFIHSPQSHLSDHSGVNWRIYRFFLRNWRPARCVLTIRRGARHIREPFFAPMLSLQLI